MTNLPHKKRKRLIITVITVAISVALLLSCLIYLNDYYRVDTAAVEAFDTDGIFEVHRQDGIIVFEPEHSTVGFIFYPGGKVEYTAYLPLMEACAAKGITCVAVEMPFNLAVLDINAAEGIQETYPHIDTWYVGGHSLGGSMAAAYVSDNTEKYDGLILLGSYSTADLSKTHLKVLSLYGSEDLVLNREKYAEYKSNLPEGTVEYVIEGGCHAGFGMYGAQDGDGTPSITAEEQILITADTIANFVLTENNNT